ncbi:Mitochondrial import protein TIM [Trema orientale]|uniref:Mitochondrial import protein TIM n=1 Tax=Trema orientale TaxID=63057 RepID=A0A2P5EQY2_TREOI|nr:Mitochondrial import protein TIM [Trema orientale]
MAATTTACGFSPALHVLSSPTTEHHRPIYSNPYSNFYKPFSASKINPTITLTRSSTKTAAPKRSYKTLVISGLENGNSETHPESDSSFSNSDATIDIKLPRRSMLVQFTCDLCTERTQRLVNRLAYERGLIYVQCAGCLQHHKLVDNLGLVVEYDLREEINVDRNEDEV